MAATAPQKPVKAQDAPKAPQTPSQPRTISKQVFSDFASI